MPGNFPGQPVSRILSGGCPAWMDIYLDGWLPIRSSGLPGDGWEMGASRPVRASLLLDLAPHGGCLSGYITAPAGGLLHHLFTLTLLIRRAVCFLWPYSKRLHASGRYPACCPMVCGLSSDASSDEPAAIRPTWSGSIGLTLYDENVGNVYKFLCA